MYKFILCLHDFNNQMYHYIMAEAPTSAKFAKIIAQKFISKRMQKPLARARIITCLIKVPHEPVAIVLQDNKEPELKKRCIELGLTLRQAAVLITRLNGNSIKETAEHLLIKPNTVRKHITNAYFTLEVKSLRKAELLLNS